MNDAEIEEIVRLVSRVMDFVDDLNERVTRLEQVLRPVIEALDESNQQPITEAEGEQ